MAEFKTEFKIDNVKCSPTEILVKLDEIIELAKSDLDAAKAKIIAFNTLLDKAVIEPGLSENSARSILNGLKRDGQGVLKYVNDQIAIKNKAELKSERYLLDAEFYINAGKKAVAASILRSYTKVCQDFKLKVNLTEFERLSKLVTQ